MAARRQAPCLGDRRIRPITDPANRIVAPIRQNIVARPCHAICTPRIVPVLTMSRRSARLVLITHVSSRFQITAKKRTSTVSY